MPHMVPATRSSGFTVIEVMLFLAVSGLMILGMFVGIGGSINRQRYEDAVYSFQDYMQGQYNIVDNVRNNRSEYICQSGAIVQASATATDLEKARGASNCIIAGQLVTTTDGRQFTSKPVVATAPSSAYDTAHDEAAFLSSLQLVAVPDEAATDIDEYKMAWSTRIQTPDSSDTAQLLIVRMPTSGIVRTYFRTTIVPDLSGFWTGSMPDELSLCVEPDGLIGTNPMGVRVLRDAVNANSVQLISAGAGVC